MFSGYRILLVIIIYYRRLANSTYFRLLRIRVSISALEPVTFEEFRPDFSSLARVFRIRAMCGTISLAITR